MSLLKDYLTELFSNQNISPTTLRSRIGFLASIDKENDHSDLKFLNNTKMVSDRIFDSSNDSTIFNRFNYIMSALDSVEKRPISKKSYDWYRNQYKQYETRKNERSNDNRATQHQIDTYEDLETLREVLVNKFIDLFDKYGIDEKFTKSKVDELANRGKNGLNLYSFGKEYQNLMIMACYVFQPALRDNWSHMKFASSVSKTKDKSFNYFKHDRNFTKCDLYMNKFKNAKVYNYETQIIKILKPEFFKNWFDFLKLVLGQAPEYVFLYNFDYKNKKIEWIDSKQGLAMRIKRASIDTFQKDISINQFRHIWEIFYHTNEKYKNHTIQELEELHQMLLHNYNTAKRYDLKLDHPDGPKK